MSEPELSVVIPSHDRPVRLRWLLNALEDQTLERERFEIVVAHDSRDAETEELLQGHPLARAGTLRHLRFPPGTVLPSAKRNAGWRAARARTVVFTDDDCRPPPYWLERALAASRRHPDAILQGTTLPDPDEAALLVAAPNSRSQRITPPTPWAECCNIVYPRELIERLGGFDEDLLTGEDTDLAARARREGVAHLAAPEVLTYHAVETAWLPNRLRSLRRWKDLPLLVKKNPELRSAHPLRMFWKPTHVFLPLVIAAVPLARRNAVWGALAIPWALRALPQYGPDPRGRLRAVSELPGRLLIDVTELGVLAWGSARSKTILL